jgi:zinc protease
MPVRRSAPRRSAKSRSIPLEAPPLQAQVRTLDNGLEVLVREDREHPLVSVQIWVKAGSLHEGEWTGAGLAHCLEHMLFKGTRKRSAQEISQQIQQLGGAVNAYTTFNRTVYYIDGLAAHAESYLEILADMARNSRLDAAELEKEQEVIRREMAMYDDDPGSVVQELLQATAFRSHPLREPVIGHRAVFDQVRQPDLAAFYRRHYVPNNCFVVITGAIEPEAAFAAVERHLGDWTRAPREEPILPDEPSQRGRREARRNFATELTRLMLGWPVPGEGHADKAALDVLAFLLGSGRSSRLYQELREKRSIAHWVWAGTWGARECGLFAVEGECDPENEAACREALQEVVEQLRQRGPAAAELAKAVRATIGGQLRSLSTTKGQAASLGHGWLASGSLEHAHHYLEAVRALTPARIREVAQRYLTPTALTTAIVGPDVETPTTRVVSTAGRGDIERYILPNGLTLLVRENPRLPLVSIRAGFLAGVPAETDANAGVTLLSAGLLLKGTKKRSAARIAAELENLGGSLHCSADAHRYVLGADVLRGDEALAIELLADLARQATLPTTGLAEVKKRQLAALQEEQEDPLTVALRRARREIFAGQPFARTALGSEATIRDIRVADCRAMLRDSLTGANGVISIDGDIRAADIRRLVKAHFGQLPRGERRPTDLPAALQKSAAKPGHWRQSLDKEQAVLVIGFRTPGLHAPATQALTLIDEACSDMGSRLFNRLREELGLAYYVGAQHFAALGAGAFYFYIGTDAAKLDLARTEMLRQIADLARRGLSVAEIERAKTAWKASWLRSQQGTAARADALGWNELNGLGHDHFQKLPDLIEAVSAADIRQAAKTWFNKGQAFIVEVVPESKKRAR